MLLKKIVSYLLFWRRKTIYMSKGLPVDSKKDDGPIIITEVINDTTFKVKRAK